MLIININPPTEIDANPKIPFSMKKVNIKPTIINKIPAVKSILFIPIFVFFYININKVTAAQFFKVVGNIKLFQYSIF